MLPNSTSEIKMTKVKKRLDAFTDSLTFPEFLLHAVYYESIALEGLVEKYFCVD